LKRAQNPWVLSLDADEALSPDLRKSILKIIEEAPQTGGFSMNRLTNYCGTWIHYSGWYPDTKLRLVRKDEAKWGGINPH